MAAALPDAAYKSVGFSSQRGTFILLDEDKNPIAPSIVWNDGRALEYQAEFGKEISPDELPDAHRHAALAAVVGREVRLAARQGAGALRAARAGSPTARSTSCTASAPRSG